MMFLFAVPVMEAVGSLSPAEHAGGARPAVSRACRPTRSGLTSIGGLAFFCRFSSDWLRTAAGSCIRRLRATRLSPGINADFWLLGIGFIEISAIAGAIEIIVGILKTRAPGHDRSTSCRSTHGRCWSSP